MSSKGLAQPGLKVSNSVCHFLKTLRTGLPDPSGISFGWQIAQVSLSLLVGINPFLA